MDYLLHVKKCSHHWSYVNKDFHHYGIYILVVGRHYKQTNGVYQRIRNTKEKCKEEMGL